MTGASSLDRDGHLCSDDLFPRTGIQVLSAQRLKGCSRVSVGNQADMYVAWAYLRDALNFNTRYICGLSLVKLFAP